MPCAAGLFVLGGQVIDFLYDITPERLEIAAMLMRISAIGVVFLSLVQTLTGIIQGLGKQQVPVMNLGIGALAKIVVMLTVMRNPAININGAAISTVVCYAVAGLLDLFYLARLARLCLPVWDLFGKPLLASVIMGASVYFAERFLAGVIASNTVCTLFAVAVGVVIYIALVLALRMFSEEDLERIPGGGRIGRLLYRRRK